MSDREWPYTIVVPALLLQDDAGARSSASVAFAPPVDLGNAFAVEFWFRPLAPPRGGAARVLTAALRLPNGAARDFVLRLDERHFTPEFQDFHGPMAPPPPGDRWTHVWVSFSSGTLRLVHWRDGKVVFDQSEGLANESYHIASLTLASENAASLLYAELRLWRPPRDDKALAEDRERPIHPDMSAGLLGYWKLDEGSGGLMIDAAQGGHDGTIQGGTYRLDSGLALRVGTVQDADGPRDSSSLSRSQAQGGRRAHWKGDAPENLLGSQLDAVERRLRMSHYMATMTLQGEGVTLDTQLRDRRAELEQVHAEATRRQGALDEALRRSGEVVAAKRDEWERRRREILDPIWASQKIHLKDFIVQLQANLSRGRDRIRSEYGRVVGMDAVSMDVKVIFGVGGAGLLLPDPAAPIDAGRLSTVKLRFRAAPTEDEDPAKWAPVPSLEGATEEFGRRKLEKAGFRVGVVYQEVGDETQDGRILAQLYDARPEDGQARLASVVTLVVGQR